MIHKLWLNKQVAPQVHTVKKSIAAVRSCGAFVFNTFPAEQAGGQNNKSLRVYPPGESRLPQYGGKKWSATSY